MKNAAGTENRFPYTVMEAVLGLNTYLQDQFSALADIYMPIEGITESKTGQEFVYRKSPATIKAKSLTLDRIYGKTLAWNQLVQNGNFANNSSWDTSGVTISMSSGVATITKTTELAAYAYQEIVLISGHRYYYRGELKSNDGTFVGIGFLGANNANVGRVATNQSTFTKVSNVYTADGAETKFILRSINASAVNSTFNAKNVYLIDLTRMFGAGNEPSTVEEFESMFPQPYYNYSAGTLISNDASALETVGFNQWDEEWESGVYSNGIKIASPDRIRCKNPIPCFPSTMYKITVVGEKSNTTFNFTFFDDNGNVISGLQVTNTTFKTPSNCHYFVFATTTSYYGTTYNHDICINLSDTSKNGTYEPYRKSTMPLNLNAIKVYSHNIWDEEWENGRININTGVNSSSNGMRSKNYIPAIVGETYYFKKRAGDTSAYVLFYDGNNGYIGYHDATSVLQFSVPSGASFMRFYIPTGDAVTTYNHDICINLSSSFNGQYEPHGILTIEGLKGAGSVYDEIVRNKYVKRVGEVDLGTLVAGDWMKQSTGNFITNKFNSVMKGASANTEKGNLLSNKLVNSVWNTAGTNSEMAVSSLSVFFVGASGVDSTSALVTFLQGVMLYYALATPIEYELAEPLVLTMAAGTTEERISSNSDGLSAPFCCDMTYSASENNDSANAQYALTAGRLLNTHKLWGQDFNGTEDVSGALSGVTTLTASDNITTAAQLISTIATGTAPLSVASTTEVANLHSYTATKLHTQRTLWGQNFDGSGNVTGDMSSVGNIAFSASGKNIASLLYFDTTNSRVGVGASSPAYKLDVNGTLNASGDTTLRGTLDVIGNTTIGGTFTVGTSSVNKATTLYGALTASGAVSFTSTLGVTGLSTLAGGIKLTTTKKIWFGDTYYIELDDNNHLHTNAGFYSNSFITAGGVGSGSGGGSNLVKERAYDISLTQITSSDYAELIRSPYISDSDSGFMFAYSPAFLDTASQIHDYVIDAIGHEIGSCDIQWIGIAIGSTYTDVGVFDSGAFLVLAKSSNTYYWYEFEV